MNKVSKFVVPGFLFLCCVVVYFLHRMHTTQSHNLARCYYKDAGSSTWLLNDQEEIPENLSYYELGKWKKGFLNDCALGYWPGSQVKHKVKTVYSLEIETQRNEAAERKATFKKYLETTRSIQ